MSKSTFDRLDAILFFGGITALTAISIDIILPATGIIARSFGQPEHLGALLVGSYFVAYAVGQLFWGLFSDAYGRRFALILSLIGFTLASFACAVATSFEFLIAMRALQGLMGGTPVIARAMVRDVSSGAEAARTLAVLTAVLTVGTLVAPVLGSGLLILFDWQAIFVALGLLGLGFLAYTLLQIEDPGTARRPERFTFRFVGQAGRSLFSTRAFLMPMAIGSAVFGGYSSLLSVGAVLTETVYGVAPEAFGSLFALTALANTAGTLLTRRLLRGGNLPRVRRIGILSLAVVSLAALALTLFTPGLPLFWLVITAYLLTFGMVYPVTVSSAMEPAADMPGFATSLMGSVSMLTGAGAAALAMWMFDGTHVAIPMVMGLFGLAAVAIHVLMRR